MYLRIIMAFSIILYPFAYNKQQTQNITPYIQQKPELHNSR